MYRTLLRRAVIAAGLLSVSSLSAAGDEPTGKLPPRWYVVPPAPTAPFAHDVRLSADGKPVFPFVATDVTTDPLTARCTADGFEVLHARAHTPIGVVPAWDVDRTTYTVDGNQVTASAATEIADNVLDEELPKKYADLVGYRLFENC